MMTYSVLGGCWRHKPPPSFDVGAAMAWLLRLAASETAALAARGGQGRDSDDPEVARVQIQKATFFYMNIPQYYPLNNMIEYLNVLFLCWEVYRGYSVSGRTDE